MNKQHKPAFNGGQGRTPSELRDDAAALTAVLILAAVAVLAAMVASK